MLVIGMLDPLGIGRSALADAEWAGLAREMYLFIAVFFFLCCFGMSRYSLYLEAKLDTSRERQVGRPDRATAAGGGNRGNHHGRRPGWSRNGPGLRGMRRFTPGSVPSPLRSGR